MSTFEKISPDDSRLTAYALGEMEPAERAEFERLLQKNPAAQATVAEISGAAHMIGTALASEPMVQGAGAPAEHLGQAAIIAGKDWSKLDGGPLLNGKKNAGEYAQSKWLRFPQMYFAISGLAAACFAIGFVIWQANYVRPTKKQYLEFELNQFAAVNARGASEPTKELKGAESPSDEKGGTAVYEHIREDAFVAASEQPMSSFPIHQATAGYGNVRRYIQSGRLPPRTAVQIEEMVNYFPYAYAPPAETDGIFAAHLEVASAPWAPEHRLVRIGLKGRSLKSGEATTTIARDVKLQVEFNPSGVQSYRLLGYENRMPRKQDFSHDKIDAGKVEAGHTVTALYEVVPVGVETPVLETLKFQKPTVVAVSDHPELLTLKISYLEPVGQAGIKKEFPLSDTGRKFEEASDDFRFAASVAAFGMILQNSPHKGTSTFANVTRWSQAGSINDPEGRRLEFVGLVEQAERLSRN